MERSIRILIALVVSLLTTLLLAYLFKICWNYSVVDGLTVAQGGARRLAYMDYGRSLVFLVLVSLFFGGVNGGRVAISNTYNM